MSKVLSCKVKENIYNTINSMEKPNSEILRELVTKYVKTLQNNTKNNGIPPSIPNKKDSEYNLLCKALDSLPVRDNRFFSKIDKKGGLD